jgi:dimethylargininase|tara:strand:+ start:410 stop:1165 length:756 start_codon:yes stop_codon:yes gene_type:complete
MNRKIALVKEPTPAFANAVSNHPESDSIDFGKALNQHRQYTYALTLVGLSVIFLDSVDDFPDSPFVEDPAIILENIAILCSMKDETRRGEVDLISSDLKFHIPVVSMLPPATMDGGDVLQTEDEIFVGLSTRTNFESIEVLQELTKKKVTPVPVLGGLHLKSAVTYLGKNILILDKAKVDAKAFERFEIVEVLPKESYAANSLVVGDYVITPQGYPKLAAKIRQLGFQVIQIPMSEFEKADGGPTCLSLII